MTRRSPWKRSLLTLVVALCTMATLLSTSSDSQPEMATAADISQFDPGNIISDAMFFDPNGLTVNQVADFIAAKGANCRVGTDGSPCLKNYRQDTFTRSPDGLCDNTYWGAANESAATIIWKVAQACSISPKVLLVLLQKEQALVTTTNPTARRYQIAAGMGCPDTAACDSQYYGFYNQLISAARQYQRYAAYPTKYSYRAGATNTIYWSPNAACGTSQVYIRNQATAGLYNYTPYRPNAAALQAGYGTGNSCSAYGNRNFWLYFTDWFGSTQSPGGDAILASYAARGGTASGLGAHTTWVYCGLVRGGCGQSYQGGMIYWSPGTGARAITAPLLQNWAAQGWEWGSLGYPTGEMFCHIKESGCGQAFQGGMIYSTPATGTRTLTGPILAAWAAQSYEVGPLGYPTREMLCGLKDGACAQAFQGGIMYTSPASGTHAISGRIADAWFAQDYERGPLGYPVTGQICGMKESGCVQVFQGGRIYDTPGTGAHAVRGPILNAWIAQNWELGPLGYATGDQVCGLAGGGCKQQFQGGTVYSSSGTGAFSVSGAMATAWTAAGAEGGALGYPVTGPICGMKESGCVQVFQGGRIYDTPGTGAHALRGAVLSAWIGQNWELGPLGYATGDQVCGLAGGGCKQEFQGGAVYSHPTAGTRVVSGEFAAAHAAAGAEGGALGYPALRMICGLKDGGCAQAFQGGILYTSPASGTHAISGSVADAWFAQDYERGPLGYPAGALTCGLAGDGCRQQFQGGAIYAHPTAGTRVVSGVFATAHAAAGGESGVLGYPTLRMICGLKDGGCAQAFQGGILYSSPASGTHAISGPIADAWMAQDYERGSLGYPSGDLTCDVGGGSCTQAFQGGILTLDTASGQVTRS